MSEWKEVTISEIAFLKNGKKRPDTSGLIPVYGGNGIMDYVNTHNDEDCIAIGRVGAYCGCVYLTKGKVWISDNAISAKANSNADNNYLYYLLDSLNLNRHRIGGAQPLMTQDLIGRIKVFLPPLPTQRRTASILSSLDDKIAINCRICENLEAQAQALFKHWFIDFEPFRDQPFVESELGMIPEGWRVCKIGELPLYITDYVANGSFASLKENVTLYNEENYAYFVRNTDLKDKTYKVYVDKHSYDFLSKSILYGGEIIISNVGDVGSVHLCPVLDKPMTLGNNIIMVKSEDKDLQNYLYILFKYSYGKGLIRGITGGSAQPKFNKTDFKSLRVVIPSEDSLRTLGSILGLYLQTLQAKDAESSRLSSLRDTLLPRLMSGEIKVGDVTL